MVNQKVRNAVGIVLATFLGGMALDKVQEPNYKTAVGPATAQEAWLGGLNPFEVNTYTNSKGEQLNFPNRGELTLANEATVLYEIDKDESITPYGLNDQGYVAPLKGAELKQFEEGPKSDLVELINTFD